MGKSFNRQIRVTNVPDSGAISRLERLYDQLLLLPARDVDLILSINEKEVLVPVGRPN